MEEEKEMKKKTCVCKTEWCTFYNKKESKVCYECYKMLKKMISKAEKEGWFE